MRRAVLTAVGAWLKSGIDKILFPSLLTAPLLGLVWVIATQSPATPTTIARIEPPPQRSIYRTTAVQLYRDYSADAAAAQARIGQRRILVTGTVLGVSKDYLGQSLVLLDVGNETSTADMTLAAGQSPLAMQLRRGQTVALFCDQMQRYSDAPTGTDCTLVEPTPGMVSLNDHEARAPHR